MKPAEPGPAELVGPAVALSRRSLIRSSILAGGLGAAGAAAAQGEAPRDQTIPVTAFGAVPDQGDPTDAIQAALLFAAPRRASVFFPAGRYRITRSVRVPNFASMVGDGLGAIIDNEHQKLFAAQLVNADPGALVHASFRNMIFRGGTHGLKLDVTGEIADLRFDDCAFELSTEAGFQANKLLQTSAFRNCIFFGSTSGLRVDGFTSNANTFYNCHFLDMRGPSLVLRTAEVNSFYACRFEGGGQPGLATIELEDARNMSFHSCYFEATHEYLLRERRSAGGVSFTDCHFTGAKNGKDLVAYRFDTDGIVTFRNNSLYRPVILPARVCIDGAHGPASARSFVYLRHGRDLNHILSPWLVPPAAAVPLLKLRLTDGPTGAAGLSALLTGRTFGAGAGQVEAQIDARGVGSGLELSIRNQPTILKARQTGPREWSIDWLPGFSAERVQWEVQSSAFSDGESYIGIDFVPAPAS